MQNRIKLAFWGLHLGAVLYMIIALIALVSIQLMPGDLKNLALVVVFSFLAFAIAIFLEIVVKALKKRRFWAWVAALIVFGIFASSVIFIPLAVLGFIGLLSQTTRKQFLELTAQHI